LFGQIGLDRQIDVGRYASVFNADALVTFVACSENQVIKPRILHFSSEQAGNAAGLDLDVHV
jgi:hypothetical protein